MSLPMISFQVPYTENEQRFLALVVQAAVREYRNRNSQSTDNPPQACGMGNGHTTTPDNPHSTVN